PRLRNRTRAAHRGAGGAAAEPRADLRTMVVSLEGGREKDPRSARRRAAGSPAPWMGELRGSRRGLGHPKRKDALGLSCDASVERSHQDGSSTREEGRGIRGREMKRSEKFDR